MTTSLTAVPKTASGPRLGGHEHELQVPDVHALGPLGGHERELVERQRPDRANRLDEREFAGVAALDVLHDPVVAGVSFGVTERGDVLVGLDLPRTNRDQQRVVLDASVPLRCERRARRGRPTPANPGSTRRRSHVRCGAADSAAAVRRRTARAPPSAGTPAPRSGRSARCPPSPPPVAVAEGAPRPRRCLRHRSLPENRSCPDRTAPASPCHRGAPTAGLRITTDAVQEPGPMCGAALPTKLAA